MSVPMNDPGRPTPGATPEEIALWLAILSTAHLAQIMSTAELPPTIDAIELLAEGYQLGDHYVPYGKTIDVSLTATNCAEITVHIPGVSRPVILKASESYDPTQTHSFHFTATESGPIEISAVNGLGEGLAATPPRPEVLVLQPPVPDPIVFSDINLGGLDDEAIQLLSDTWMHYREYGLELDTAEFGRESVTISDALREEIGDVSGFHARSATRLREVMAAYPAMANAVMRAMAGVPTAQRDLRLPSAFNMLRVPAVPRVVPEAIPGEWDDDND